MILDCHICKPWCKYQRPLVLSRSTWMSITSLVASKSTLRSKAMLILRLLYRGEKRGGEVRNRNGDEKSVNTKYGIETHATLTHPLWLCLPTRAEAWCRTEGCRQARCCWTWFFYSWTTISGLPDDVVCHLFGMQLKKVKSAIPVFAPDTWFSRGNFY